MLRKTWKTKKRKSCYFFKWKQLNRTTSFLFNLNKESLLFISKYPTEHFLLHFLPLDMQILYAYHSKDFYIYGKVYAYKWMISYNDSIMIVYDLFMIYDVWFILTIIMRHPLYWNYGHNLFLLKYFYKTCTDKYLCTLLHCK